MFDIYKHPQVARQLLAFWKVWLKLVNLWRPLKNQPKHPQKAVTSITLRQSSFQSKFYSRECFMSWKAYLRLICRFSNLCIIERKKRVSMKNWIVMSFVVCLLHPMIQRLKHEKRCIPIVLTVVQKTWYIRDTQYIIQLLHGKKKFTKACRPIHLKPNSVQLYEIW